MYCEERNAFYFYTRIHYSNNMKHAHNGTLTKLRENGSF